MVIYVPGTEETDPKKQNMSLQAIGAAATTAIANVATNTTNIATNTTNIATNTTNIATNTTNITALQTPNYGLVNSGGSLGVLLSKITASLGADVALNVAANYFPGPTVAQGSTGTWFASGQVTFLNAGGATTFHAKLWDGTTIIDTGAFTTGGANFLGCISLSGYLAAPAGNLRIDVREVTGAGTLKFNTTGNSKDSTITAFRIA